MLPQSDLYGRDDIYRPVLSHFTEKDIEAPGRKMYLIYYRMAGSNELKFEIRSN